MASFLLDNQRKIGDYSQPYIVAELNTSHFGNIDIAKNMINSAKEVGCDCVKFQSWNTTSLYCDEYYASNKIAKRVVKGFSLSESDLYELSQYCSNLKIDFASTPYSIEEATFLVSKCRVPFIKIASMEVNNLSYLHQLAALNVPLILSTGMSTIDEIEDAVDCIKSINNRFAILHCTSLYPTEPISINLNNILYLRNKFPDHPIGFSDHSVGHEIPSASIALGSAIIEKHFTLDSSKIGMDNQMATEPEEMSKLVDNCRTVYESMGSYERSLTPEEIDMSIKMRRSIVAKSDINPGQILDTNILEFKRPGSGIPPSKIDLIIGKKVTKAIKKGYLINEDHFL